MSPLAPLIASWTAGAALLLLDGRRRWVASLAVVALAAVLLLDLDVLATMIERGDAPYEVVTGGWPAGVGIRLRVDRLSLFFGALCAFVLAVVMAHEARQRALSRLFPAMLVTLCAGLHGAFFTGDLFDFYVFFELTVVTSFGLAAYGYGRAEIRGAFTYVVLNLIGSVLFLVGTGSVYQTTGTLDMQQIAAESHRGAELLVAAALLFAGMSLKVALFPLHAWAPVLYSHARPSIAAALCGALVNIGAYGLVRFGFVMLDEARAQAAVVLIVLGLASTFYGALVALHRSRPAEIAGYSSVAQAGYVVLALGVGGAHGVAAALLAVLAGSLDKASLFLCLGAGGRARTAAALTSAASLAGLPLTTGFVAKVALFRATLGAPGAAWVTAGFLIASVLVLVASFRFWYLSHATRPARETSSLALALAAATLVVGIYPELASSCADVLALELLAGAP